MKRLKVSWSIAGALGIAAGIAWLAYVANWIAYEDLLGTPGKEAQVRAIVTKANASLTLALGAETLALSWIFWLLTQHFENARNRLLVAALIGIALSGCTFVLLRH